MFYIETLLERGDIIYICGQLEALARHKQDSGFNILLCPQMNKNPKTHFPECSLEAFVLGTWAKDQLTPFLFCSRDLSTWTIAHPIAERFLHWAGKKGCDKPSPESSAQGRADFLINVCLLSRSPEATPMPAGLLVLRACSQCEQTSNRKNIWVPQNVSLPRRGGVLSHD